jgi:hypothetical protein
MDQMTLVDHVSQHWRGIVGGRGMTAAEFMTYVASIKFRNWVPRFVVLHNTAKPTLKDWHASDPAVRVNESLVTYYRDCMHWQGGPHVFVADDLIWPFTPLWVQGTHSPSWNEVSWGVEMVGDYSVDPLPVGVRDNTIAVLAALHNRISADPRTLKLHREDPLTKHLCPGDQVKKDDMVRMVCAALNHDTAPDGNISV